MTLSSDPQTLDVNTDVGMDLYDLSRAPYDSLIIVDQRGGTMKLSPRLAKSWTVSPDGKTYTFKLRDDVVFHNGSKFTSADVKFTLDRYRNPPKDVRSAHVASLQPVASVDAPDPTTVVLHLKASSGPLMGRLSNLNSLVMLSRAWIEGGANPLTEIMGTGPFMLTKATRGTSYVFDKNPKFWQPGRPYLDGVTYFVIKDAETRFAALRTGRVHTLQNYFVQLSPAQYRDMQKIRPDLQMFPDNIRKAPWVWFNLRKAPWTDLRVRQAINLALDRREAVRSLFDGAGELGDMYTFRQPPGIPQAELLKMPGWAENKKAERDQAKKLLADAGFPSGMQTTVLTRDITDFKDAAVFFVDQLSTIGIKAKVEIQDTGVVFARGRSGDYDLMVLQSTDLRPDASDDTQLWHLKGGAVNFGILDDPKLVALYQEQDGIADSAARQKVVEKMDRYIQDTLPSLRMGWSFGYDAIAPDVKDWPKRADGRGQDVLEHVWLSK